MSQPKVDALPYWGTWASKVIGGSGTPSLRWFGSVPHPVPDNYNGGITLASGQSDSSVQDGNQVTSDIIK